MYFVFLGTPPCSLGCTEIGANCSIFGNIILTLWSIILEKEMCHWKSIFLFHLKLSGTNQIFWYDLHVGGGFYFSCGGKVLAIWNENFFWLFGSGGNFLVRNWNFRNFLFLFFFFLGGGTALNDTMPPWMFLFLFKENKMNF